MRRPSKEKELRCPQNAPLALMFAQQIFALDIHILCFLVCTLTQHCQTFHQTVMAGFSELIGWNEGLVDTHTTNNVKFHV